MQMSIESRAALVPELPASKDYRQVKSSGIIAVVLVVLLAGFGVYEGQKSGWFDGARQIAGGQVPAAAAPKIDDSQRTVVALGRFEPLDGVINVAAPMGDRLKSLEVKQGDVVKKGQVLAILDSRELRVLEREGLERQISELGARREAEENVARSRLKLAKIAIDRAKSQSAEYDAKAKEIDLIEASLELARKDLSRLTGLSEKLVSQQELERQRLVVRKADAELTAAQSALDRLKEGQRLALEAAQADLVVAQAMLDAVSSAVPTESVKKSLELVEAQFERTAIVAPSDGTILKTYIRPGELIGSRPILQLADLTQMACVAEVYETDIKRIQKGQTALIHSNVFQPPFLEKGLRGSVQDIGRMIATPELKSLDPFARTDRHVVEVRVLLDKESTAGASNLVNLQVDVKFQPLTPPAGNPRTEQATK